MHNRFYRLHLISVADYFWISGSSYLFLQQLAELLLRMSADSVPTECVAGLICNSKRSILCPNKLPKICFLHGKVQFIKDTCDI